MRITMYLEDVLKLMVALVCVGVVSIVGSALFGLYKIISWIF